MKYIFRTTKTRIYIKDAEGNVFVGSRKPGSQGDKLDLNNLNDSQRMVLSWKDGWRELDADSIADAFTRYHAMFFAEREARRKELLEWRDKYEEERQREWDEVKDLPVIPATVENVRRLLHHLNQQNWGGWQLPRLSIGYRAAQYDCDGKQASAIILDAPIFDDNVKGSKFQTGAPRGHLSKYIRI